MEKLEQAARQALRLGEIDRQEPVAVKPLPGADWTIPMRRMLKSVSGGCSKRECRCKPEDAPNCIWWDEPEQPAASKPWVGLTDDDWKDIADTAGQIIWSDVKQAIEAKLREKNT